MGLCQCLVGLQHVVRCWLVTAWSSAGYPVLCRKSVWPSNGAVLSICGPWWCVSWAISWLLAWQRWDNIPLGYRQQATSPKHEKVMMGQLQIFKDTQFRRFPLDWAQLCIPALQLESGRGHLHSIGLLEYVERTCLQSCILHWAPTPCIPQADS